jgi:putative phosphoribosyl transferase
VFIDRRDAGTQLARRLGGYAEMSPVVVGLPRGGVPVATEVASALHAPLDIIVVRKLGCPWHPELGVGAIAEGGVRVINHALVRELEITADELATAVDREAAELERRVRRYRGDRPMIPVGGRIVILVDDGLATGYTARAAVEAMRRRGAARVILAVPVASTTGAADLRHCADEVVAVMTPPWLVAIGEFYDDFSQTTDDAVAASLERRAPAPSTRLRRPRRRGPVAVG